jgi:mediator of RNA polymerase II transcription subunit 16
MSWLIDCLLHSENGEIFDEVRQGQPPKLDDISSHLFASNNIALHILLSSATRGFLTAICRRLIHLDYTARKAMSSAAQSAYSGPPGQTVPLISNSLRTSYTAIATLTSGSIVPIRVFEALVARISESIKESYTAAKLPSQKQAQGIQGEHSRNSIEQQVLFGGPLPIEMAVTIARIFHSELPKLRNVIDPSKLFFHDFSILGLPAPKAPMGPGFPLPGTTKADEIAAEADAVYRVTHTLDVFSRVPIQLGTEHEEGHGLEMSGPRLGRRWRRCTRCAAAMDDIISQRPAVQFLIMQQRRCYCSGNWDIMTGKTAVP